MYKVGDIVEIIYKDVIGAGDIVKIEKGFFFKTYYVRTIVTSTNLFTGVETDSEKVLKIDEDDIIRKVGEVKGVATDKNEWEEITKIFQVAIKRRNLSRSEVDRIIDKIYEED